MSVLFPTVAAEWCLAHSRCSTNIYGMNEGMIAIVISVASVVFGSPKAEDQMRRTERKSKLAHPETHGLNLSLLSLFFSFSLFSSLFLFLLSLSLCLFLLPSSSFSSSLCRPPFLSLSLTCHSFSPSQHQPPSPPAFCITCVVQLELSYVPLEEKRKQGNQSSFFCPPSYAASSQGADLGMFFF